MLENNEGSEFGIQTKCRSCKGNNLKEVINLGKSPLANNLIDENNLETKESFPLGMIYCKDCHLCQLPYVVPPEEMFKEYLYVTSTTQLTKNHFKKVAETFVKSFNLNSNSLVVDIGSNDGGFLKFLNEKGVNTIGIEPAGNICEIAKENGVETICDFINSESVEKIIERKGKADLVVANNVFAHVNDTISFTKNVKKMLKENGVFIIEAQYLLDTIKGLSFDNIYHEHHSYYSVLALDNFFKNQRMQIIKIEYFDLHGGSIRVYVQKEGANNPIHLSVRDFIEEEKRFGLDNFTAYKEYAQKIENKRKAVVDLIKQLKSEGNSLAGYGSPAKATTLLNFYGIDDNLLDYIVEDNPLKLGKIVPGANIPIKNPKELLKNQPDYVYVLAWNYIEEILKNNSEYRKNGGKFIISFPKLKIL